MSTITEVLGRLLTVPEVAARLNMPTSWVYTKVEADDLPYFRIGRYVRFRAEDIDAYLERQRQGK